MKFINQLTEQDWEVIRDALEMRHKEGIKLARDMMQVNERLGLTFKHIAERAEATLAKLEELELV